MPLQLRTYQAEAVARVWSAWMERGIPSPAVVMATGGGKTHVIASLAEQWVQRHPPGSAGRTVLILAHRKELIDQAAERVRKTGIRARVGIVKGSRNECSAPIVVGSVPTLRSEARRRLVRNVGMIVIDECHHATAQSYRDILDHYRVGKEDGAVSVGFTATMMRSDGTQLSDIWDEIVYNLELLDLIEMGYLVPPVAHHVKVKDLDLRKVKKSHGDYQAEDLAKALGQSLAPSAVIRAYRAHAPGKQALLFAPTVSLAEEMEEHFERAGYRTATVHGATPAGVRDAIIKRYKAREVDVLCNCGVFTEGTDLPSTECIIMMRPTKSKSLFIQIAGRGARVDPDNPNKTHYVFLDVCGASQENTLSASIELFGEPVKTRESDDGDELLEDTEPGGGRIEGERVDGELQSERVDILTSRRPVWRQTALGAWFIPRAGGRLLAIVPSATMGRVDLYELGQSVGDGLVVREAIATTSEAMRQAETLLTGHEVGRLAGGAKWRLARPSGPLLSAARAHGIAVPDDMTAGRLSEKIQIKEASARIDPCTARRAAEIRKWCGGA